MTTTFRASIYYKILEQDLAGIKNGIQDLDVHFEETTRFLRSVPEAKAAFAYAPGKWTVSQVLGHFLDTRVVFLNRLLYITRGEDVPLLPFDEDLWVRHAGHENVSIPSLLEIHTAGAALVSATVKSLPAGALSKSGTANKVLITAEEILLYMMAHEKHHQKVIADRYLKP